MLELNDIKKDYPVADEVVHALKGVSIKFRNSEFVSVLGPSGCGKTTLLNIIGGLDHSTSGDLVINGVSTSEFKDRDWDTYRNHSIGFVFQSYNLIPHQSILENVELALNIAGVAKEERVRRAKDALDKVGLAGLYKKKPNQLSGGQCQRVAIARALVSDPEILLADEPTGALDTETSVQIMDLIKEISKSRLVIMVTHNPDIAERYSTRIVRLLDGEVVDDTCPYDGSDWSAPETLESVDAPDEAVKEGEASASAQPSDETVNADEKAAEKAPADSAKKEKNSDKKSKLSFWSAFRLSARNLLSKLKRTILVCFAGSIGIIGVATVLAVSTGVSNFIKDMQDDMLSGNPVQVQETAMDMSGIMEMSDAATKGAAVSQSVENGKINVNFMIEFLAARIDDLETMMISNDITQEYIDFVKGMPKEYYAAIEVSHGIDMSNNIYTKYKFEGQDDAILSYSAAKNIYTSVLEATKYKDYAQYISMLASNFKEAPSSKDFVLGQYDILNDGGYFPTQKDEIMIVVDAKTRITDVLLAQLGYYSQAEFLNIAYKAVEDDDYDKTLDKDKFTYAELTDSEAHPFVWYPNDTVYKKLTPTAQNPSPFSYNYKKTDDFTGGVPLKVTAILRPKKGLSYGCLSAGVYYTTELAEHAAATAAESEVVKYLNDTDMPSYSSAYYMEIAAKKDPTSAPPITYAYSYSYDGKPDVAIGTVGTENQLSTLLSMFGGDMMSGMDFSISTLSLRQIGGLKVPNKISIYPTNFEYKDKVTSYIKQWNDDKDITVTLADGTTKTLKKEDRAEIKYTDNLALVIDMINDLVDIITAALVAFTSLSLVVSTIMIAIITYVSVIERIKEIGVIRSLGGRKRDVSRLFTAETFIIGLVSGIIGIFVTFLLTLLINGIVGHYAGVSTIATLTAPIIFIMIGVSVALTLISGLIPARLAAKKDPVVALRSE